MRLTVPIGETLVKLNGNSYLLSQEGSQAGVGISEIWPILDGLLQQHDGFFRLLLGPAGDREKDSSH